MRARGKLLWAVAGLAASWAVLSFAGWLPRVTPEQRAALTLLRAPEPALAGRNVTLAAWLLARDVAPAEWPRYLALPEVEAQAALAALPAAIDVAAKAWPECLTRGQGCLQRVRADPAAARLTRDALAPRLAQIEQLQRDYAHAAQIGEPDLESPLPPFGSLHLPVRLDAALRFVEGDHDGALTRLCRHARWWRGLRRNTDLLLVDMLGVAVVGGAAHSWTEMLAALPSDAVLPPECTDAFAPLETAELAQCRALKNDFRMIDRGLRIGLEGKPGQAPNVGNALTRGLLYRHEPTLAMIAPGYARFCDAAHAERLAARAELPPHAPSLCGADGWVFNYVGCVLANAAPDFATYHRRALDFDGMLRLAASAEWWWRAASADAAAFARRPPALRDARHRLGGTRCAPTLQFEARVPRAGEPAWTVPLAAPADCAAAASP